TSAPTQRSVTLPSELAAAAERLCRALPDPSQLARSCGPPGWPARFTELDPRVGGLAKYFMTGPRGETSGGQWEFLAIDPPHSFEVTDSFVDAEGNIMTELPSMRMTFDFQPTETGTRPVNITFFDSLQALAKVVEMGAVEG